MKVEVVDVTSWKTDGPTNFMAIVKDEAGELHHTESQMSAGGVGALAKVLEEIVRRWPDTDRSATSQKLIFIHFMNMSRGTDGSGADYPRRFG